MALSKYDIILAQRTANEEVGLSIKPDGAIGPASRDAFKKWQALKGLPQTSQLDTTTWTAMQPYIAERFITVNDIINAARNEKLPPSMLLAFWEVESVGAGFLPDKRCTILFEGAKFYEYAAARLSRKQADDWARKYPNICHKVWDASTYYGGAAEWKRLEQARALDATCALLSTSWGVFQLMGFNFAYGGFRDVQTMVEMHMTSEHNHLRAIINYINNYKIGKDLASTLGVDGLREAIASRNYTASARIYNGSGYAKHNYHTRLREADLKWFRQI